MLRDGGTSMLLLATAILLSLVVSADAGATLAIEAVRFSNEEGTLKDGGFCEAWLHLTDPCDHKFTFCLFPYYGGCGSTFKTGVYDNRGNTVDFGSPLNSDVHIVNPMRHHIDGRFKEPFSLKVTVLEDDTHFTPPYNADDDVDTFDITESISPYDGTVTRYYKGTRKNNPTSLQLKLTLTCDANHFGSGCDVFCAPRDDHYGHYVCDNRSGGKRCLRGWAGPNCNTPVCRQGCDKGTCTRPGECNCNDGYQGDICNQSVCRQGCDKGTCTRPGECNCNDGYQGDICNQPVCRQGCDKGTCTRPGECNCNDGYQGDICNQLVNPCLEDVLCANGGTCSSEGTAVGQFECSCVAGYTGVRCEDLVDNCGAASCQNGATCVNALLSFACQCAPGFTGDSCEVDIDDCASNPCKNGGACTDKVADYECSCPDTLDGSEPPKNCSGPPCEYLLCRNNGTCIGRREGGSVSSSSAADGGPCACPEGFTGPFCEVAVPDSADDVSVWLMPDVFFILGVASIFAVFIYFFYIWRRYFRNARPDVIASYRLLIRTATGKLKRPVIKVSKHFKKSLRSLKVMCRPSKEIKYGLLSQSDAASLDLDMHTAAPRSDSVKCKKPNSCEYGLLSPKPHDYVIVSGCCSHWANKLMSPDVDEDVEGGAAAKCMNDDQALYTVSNKQELGDFV